MSLQEFLCVRIVAPHPCVPMFIHSVVHSVVPHCMGEVARRYDACSGRGLSVVPDATRMAGHASWNPKKAAIEPCGRSSYDAMTAEGARKDNGSKQHHSSSNSIRTLVLVVLV